MVDLEQLRIILYFPLHPTDFCKANWAISKLEIKLVLVLQDKVLSRSNGKNQLFPNVDKKYDSGHVISIPIHTQSTKTAEEKHQSTVASSRNK